MQAGSWLEALQSSRLTCTTVALAALIGMAGHAEAQEEFTEVKVVVNVLTGAREARDDQIKDALNEANKILKQAKVKLVHVKTNRDVSDGGNNDGRIDPEERDQLQKNGENELNAVLGKGKGFKLNVSLAADSTDSSVLGNTVHCIPVAITEHPPAPPDWGYVIAHEFCHSFTLPGHEDSNGQTWGTDNLMDPIAFGGTTLTDEQRREVKKKADERGDTRKKAAENQAPQKKSQENGSGSDQRSGEGGEPPGIPPRSDLRRYDIVSDSTTGMVRGYVQMHGLLDPQQVTQVRIYTYIDTDGNPATGESVVIDGMPLGAEYRVEITLLGNGGGSLQLQGKIKNTINTQEIALADLVLETENRVVCFLEGQSDLTPVLDQINYEFPRSFMGALTSPSLVGARILDDVAATADESWFELRSRPSGGAALVLSKYQALPGEPITVSGGGFMPQSTVSVTVDDLAAVSGTTNAQGGFSVPLTAPGGGSAYYWIDARDASGNADFTILHVRSALPLPVLGAPGLVILAMLLAGAAAALLRRAVI